MRSSGTAPSFRGVLVLPLRWATLFAVGVRNPNEGCGFLDGVCGTNGTSRSCHCEGDAPDDDLFDESGEGGNRGELDPDDELEVERGTSSGCK
jgi:hypothetical protein